MSRAKILEPPVRADISHAPTVDAVVEVIRRWHDDVRHEGTFEFCGERPCCEVVTELRRRWW